MQVSWRVTLCARILTLLCVEFAFYVNKTGWRARPRWAIQWEGVPTSFGTSPRSPTFGTRLTLTLFSFTLSVHSGFRAHVRGSPTRRNRPSRADNPRQSHPVPFCRRPAFANTYPAGSLDPISQCHRWPSSSAPRWCLQSNPTRQHIRASATSWTPAASDPEPDHLCVG